MFFRDIAFGMKWVTSWNPKNGYIKNDMFPVQRSQSVYNPLYVSHPENPFFNPDTHEDCNCSTKNFYQFFSTDFSFKK